MGRGVVLNAATLRFWGEMTDSVDGVASDNVRQTSERWSFAWGNMLEGYRAQRKRSKYLEVVICAR